MHCLRYTNHAHAKTIIFVGFCERKWKKERERVDERERMKERERKRKSGRKI